MSETADLKRMALGAFKRKVSNTWIDPEKSRPYYEDMRRVFCKDESPEGLYPACVVPQHLLGKVVIVIPEERLLERIAQEKGFTTVVTFIEEEILGKSVDATTIRKLYWKRFQLHDKPTTCYICGMGVTVENCGAMTWHYGETVVCCDDQQDLKHFKRFVKEKKLNWVCFVKEGF